MDIDVRSMDIGEAFNTLKTLDDGSEEYRETERKAIKGIKIRFSIFDVIKMRGNIVEKGKNRKMIINGKSVDMEDFDIEMMEREKAIKRFLIEKLEGRQIAKPRGLK